MWVSSSYIELFNPYHDKLGRFTFKKGAGAAQVSGKAQKWIDKPVATIGGKTVTRKHVAIAAGVTAAAAVAVGATVIVSKRGVPPITIRSKMTEIHPGEEGSLKRPYPKFKENVEKFKRIHRKTDNIMDRYDPHRSAGFDGKNKAVYWTNQDVWDEKLGREVVAGVADDGTIHYSPQLVAQGRTRELTRVALHESIHARNRSVFWNSPRDEFIHSHKLQQSFFPGGGWIEEGMTETITSTLNPFKVQRVGAYKRFSDGIAYALHQETGGNAKHSAQLLRDMHRFNADPSSLEDFVKDMNFYSKSVYKKQTTGSLLLRTLFRSGKGPAYARFADPSKSLGFMDSETWQKTWIDGGKMEEWIAKMREATYSYLLEARTPEFPGLELSDSESGGLESDFLSKSEKALIDKFGSIYIPSSVFSELGGAR